MVDLNWPCHAIFFTNDSFRIVVIYTVLHNEGHAWHSMHVCGDRMRVVMHVQYMYMYMYVEVRNGQQWVHVYVFSSFTCTHVHYVHADGHMINRQAQAGTDRDRQTD